MNLLGFHEFKCRIDELTIIVLIFILHKDEIQYLSSNQLTKNWYIYSITVWMIEIWRELIINEISYLNSKYTLLLLWKLHSPSITQDHQIRPVKLPVDILPTNRPPLLPNTSRQHHITLHRPQQFHPIIRIPNRGHIKLPISRHWQHRVFFVDFQLPFASSERSALCQQLCSVSSKGWFVHRDEHLACVSGIRAAVCLLIVLCHQSGGHRLYTNLCADWDEIWQ